MRCCRAAADYRFPIRGIKQRAGFSDPDWTKHVCAWWRLGDEENSEKIAKCTRETAGRVDAAAT